MYARERQQLIVERARQEGRVDVTGLAGQLQVTPETIRRDLTVLEEHGFLHRVHGGAIPVERWSFDPQLSARENVMVAEKTRICRAALDEVPAEGAVLIESGTTCARFAELLPTDRPLTVITDSLSIAVSLASRPNLSVLTPGGRVRATTNGGVGSWAAQRWREVFADVAFLGTDGVSLHRGLTMPDQNSAEIKTLLLRGARRRVLLADHTKIGPVSLHRYGEIAEVDVLITDTGLDGDIATDIEAAGPKVVRV